MDPKHLEKKNKFSAHVNSYGSQVNRVYRDETASAIHLKCAGIVSVKKNETSEHCIDVPYTRTFDNLLCTHSHYTTSALCTHSPASYRCAYCVIRSARLPPK